MRWFSGCRSQVPFTHQSRTSAIWKRSRNYSASFRKLRTRPQVCWHLSSFPFVGPTLLEAQPLDLNRRKSTYEPWWVRNSGLWPLDSSGLPNVRTLHDRGGAGRARFFRCCCYKQASYCCSFDVFFVMVACAYWRLSFVSWTVYGWIQMFIYGLSLTTAREGTPPSAAEIGFSFFQLFLTALSRTASSAWVILMSAGLSAVVTLLGAMISTRGTLCTRMALMAHISAGADLVTRRTEEYRLCTGVFDQWLWIPHCLVGSASMPDFEVSMAFVVGLALVSLASRYMAITVMLAACNRQALLCSSLTLVSCRWKSFSLFWEALLHLKGMTFPRSFWFSSFSGILSSSFVCSWHFTYQMMGPDVFWQQHFFRRLSTRNLLTPRLWMPVWRVTSNGPSAMKNLPNHDALVLSRSIDRQSSLQPGAARDLMKAVRMENCVASWSVAMFCVNQERLLAAVPLTMTVTRPPTIHSADRMMNFQRLINLSAFFLLLEERNIKERLCGFPPLRLMKTLWINKTHQNATGAPTELNNRDAVGEAAALCLYSCLLQECDVEGFTTRRVCLWHPWWWIALLKVVISGSRVLFWEMALKRQAFMQEDLVTQGMASFSCPSRVQPFTSICRPWLLSSARASFWTLCFFRLPGQKEISCALLLKLDRWFVLSWRTLSDYSASFWDGGRSQQSAEADLETTGDSLLVSTEQLSLAKFPWNPQRFYLCGLLCFQECRKGWLSSVAPFKPCRVARRMEVAGPQERPRRIPRLFATPSHWPYRCTVFQCQVQRRLRVFNGRQFAHVPGAPMILTRT